MTNENQDFRQESSLANNSGQGPNSPVIDLVAKKFNWGAFCLNWIWGLFNKTFLPLIVLGVIFIPFVGGFISIGLCIWFGIKGNTWAWQNKRWNSIEHFHSVQKNWAIAGIILFVLNIVISIFGMIAAMTLPALMTDTSAQVQKVQTRKACNTLIEASQISYALEDKCQATSEGLAGCLGEHMEGYLNGNVLSMKDGSNWEFHGDGSCADETSCWVDVTFNKSKNKLRIPMVIKDNQIIPLTKDILKNLEK